MGVLNSRYLRFLSTNGSLVPVSAGAEVFLFGSHNLLKGTDIWAMDGVRNIKKKKKSLYTSIGVLYNTAAYTDFVKQE